MVGRAEVATSAGAPSIARTLDQPRSPGRRAWSSDAPRFFETAAQFGAWLAKHGQSEPELVVDFHKRAFGLASISWPESVDEALCCGWIDDVRTRIDERSYKIRFTPRRATSTWSAVNIERVRLLTLQGRLQTAGLLAFSHRRTSKSKIYSYEQEQTTALTAQESALFRKNKATWDFFEAQPPCYRQLVVWRIVSAKRKTSRSARLARLIEASQCKTRL